MRSMWNFLTGLSDDLSNFNLDELNTKLKELDMDKHLDTLEKAFDVQKHIIDRLKEENTLLKTEIKVLKDKYEHKNVIKVPYPLLKSKRCNVLWSQLENNAVESRVIELVRRRIIRKQIELEVQPWLVSSIPSQKIPCVHPLIVFSSYKDICSDKNMENLFKNFQNKVFSPMTFVIMLDELDSRTSLDKCHKLITELSAEFKLIQIVNVIQSDSFDELANQNEESIEKICDFICQTKD